MTKINLKRMKYRTMAKLIDDIAKEVKSRNSIGVNMYLPPIRIAREALLEISNGEKHNFTSEHGPKE